MSDQLLANLVVTSIDADNRRHEFFKLLLQRRLKSFENNSNYDYALVDSLVSPSAIYDAYQQHNGKFVIFDTDQIFKRKQYLDVAQGGFCSSPDSGDKWSVQYLNRPSFVFNGHVIILTSLTKQEIQNDSEKFKYILRDMRVI